MKEFTAGTDYEVIGISEYVDRDSVKDSEFLTRMINLRFSPKMLNDWFDFDTNLIADALFYSSREEYCKHCNEVEELRKEFEGALKKALEIPENDSFVLSQGLSEFFTVVTMHMQKGN